MDEMTVKALAKINIGLDVTGVREDGYHLVRMIMQTIHMYDLVTVSKSAEAGITMKSNAKYLPTNDDNLCVNPSSFSDVFILVQSLLYHSITKSSTYLCMQKTTIYKNEFAKKITEKLKAENQMEWIARLFLFNLLRHHLTNRKLYEVRLNPYPLPYYFPFASLNLRRNLLPYCRT
jgi:hypothetical protein